MLEEKRNSWLSSFNNIIKRTPETVEFIKENITTGYKKSLSLITC